MSVWHNWYFDMGLNEWHNHIGPETPTKHQDRPYIDTGWRVHLKWNQVHTWCQKNSIVYSWNGSRFNFENLDDLLWFCDTWMREDEFIDDEEF